MSDTIVVEIKKKKEGVRVNTKGENVKITERKKNLRMNGLKCSNEFRKFLEFQIKASINLFKFLFYSLAWFGDICLIVVSKLPKQKNIKKDNKEGALF